MVSESQWPQGSRFVPLTQLREGDAGQLLQVTAPPDLALQLAEAGFTLGVRIRLLRRAPLGSPLAVEVNGTRYCLRAETAASLLVSEHD